MHKTGAPGAELLTGGTNWQMKCAGGNRQILMLGNAILLAAAIA
jgi:hypothetical protein